MFLEGNKHLNSPSLSESQSNLENAQQSELLGTSASKSLWCFWVCYPKAQLASCLGGFASWGPAGAPSKSCGAGGAAAGLAGAGSSAGSHSQHSNSSLQGRRLVQGRLRDERLMLKSTVPVLEFPAAVVVPVRLPTQVTELFILDRKQICPLILSRLILPQLPSLAEHGRLPRLCKRSCSFSSAPSGVFPSEPEFIPLFTSDIHTCFVAGLSEVFYRSCRPRRSLRGGTLIKKRNTCLGKKKMRGFLDPEFNRAFIWPGCMARTSWETPTHLSLIRTF